MEETINSATAAQLQSAFRLLDELTSLHYTDRLLEVKLHYAYDELSSVIRYLKKRPELVKTS